MIRQPFTCSVQKQLDQFTLLNSHTPEEDIVDRALHGLAEVFRPFARAIKARLEPVSCVVLHGLLLSEELPQKMQNLLSDVFSMTAIYGARSGFRFAARGGCMQGQRDHRTPRTYSSHSDRANPSDGNVSNTTSSYMQCHNCFGYGHISQQCYRGHPTRGPRLHFFAQPPPSSYHPVRI